MGLNFICSSSKSDKSGSIFSKKSSSSFDRIVEKVVYKNLPNPQPDRYKILKSLKINNYLIIKIKYLDCINYEGKKILIFENCTVSQLNKQKLIDPHFSENKNFKSPIARFEPTEKGWKLAKILCKYGTLLC